MSRGIQVNEEKTALSVPSGSTGSACFSAAGLMGITLTGEDSMVLQRGCKITSTAQVKSAAPSHTPGKADGNSYCL